MFLFVKSFPNGNINKTPNILTKQLPNSHHCPFWHEHHHWGIFIQGYTFGSVIQGPTNLITFLGLCSPGDYR